jgi:DNA-binding GntR family transcriptional regulator
MADSLRVRPNTATPDPLHERIRDLIVTGRLAPGMRLIERELAERLGLSRTPVRHVLARLQQEGFVVPVPGGTYNRLMVAPLTKQEAREVYHIMGALDGLVAWYAAQLRSDEREQLVEDMVRVNENLRAAGHARPADPQALFSLHTEFHDLYLEAIHSPRLAALHGTLKPQAERYRRIYSSVADTEPLERSLDEHLPIIEALRAGDAKWAREAAIENWTRAGERLERMVELLGEHGHW